MKGSSEQRQAWLENATTSLRTYLTGLGETVPDHVRVSIGFPQSGRKAIGECWYPEASADEAHEIFVSPKLDDSVTVLATLAHELIHTVAGHKAKHGAAFKRIATNIGLEGKMTATMAGDVFKAWCVPFIGLNGEYPAGAITHNMHKKQSTRLLKASCPECDYTVRLTKKWASMGLPTCSMCEVEFKLEGEESEDA